MSKQTDSVRQDEDQLRVLACQVAVPEPTTSASQRDDNVVRIIGLIRNKVAKLSQHSEKNVNTNNNNNSNNNSPSLKNVVDLVVLPELSCIGFDRVTLDHVKKHLAEKCELRETNAPAACDDGAPSSSSPSDRPPSTVDRLAALATELDCFICFGMPRIGDDGDDNDRPIHISQIIVGPPSTGDEKTGRIVSVYDKIHCWEGEKKHFQPSICPKEQKHSLTITTVKKGFRVCPIICYDFRFPEIMRRAALHDDKKGVDLFLHCSGFARDATFFSRDACVMTRAVENLTPVLALNRGGKNYGRSIFCSAHCSGVFQLPPVDDDDDKSENNHIAVPLPHSPRTMCIFSDFEEELRLVRISREETAACRREFTFREDMLSDYDAGVIIKEAS